MPPVDAASLSPLSLLLPAVTAASASASRLLHDERLAGAWAALDPGRRVSLRGVADAGAGALYRVDFDSFAGRGALAVSARDDIGLALASAPDLGDALRALAALALLGDVARRADESVLPGARPVSTAVLPRDAAPAHGWCALHRDGVETARIAVLALAPEVESQLRAGARAGRRCVEWRARMRLAGAVTLAERAFGIGLLGSLSPGDVLVLPVTALDGAAGTWRPGAGGERRPAARGRIRAGRFIFDGGLHMMDDDPALLADARGEAEALDELELPVRFELETVSLALDQLESLERGYVIEFATPVDEARLRLVSCGHVIGYADLVSVSGRLGARITRVVARNDTDLANL